MGFGHTRHNAAATLAQSLSIPFDTTLNNFIDQWQRTSKRLALLDKIAPHDSSLFARSVNLLLAHEDKIYPGAMIASLSIPWGEDKGDDDLGGYHLVWTRDMVNSATALLAVGDTATPLRALIYLAITQREDGGFYQNFWIDGRPLLDGRAARRGLLPHHAGVAIVEGRCPRQLRSLHHRGAGLRLSHPRRSGHAAGALGGSRGLFAIHAGQQHRGPDLRGGVLRGARRQRHSAEFVRTYADFLESHVEKWTVTNHGTLVPGITRHYIRINPAISSAGRSRRRRPRSAACWCWPTSGPATATSIRRRKLWMRAFWNWCASASASPAIR